jgi:hypothetical protein
MLNKIYSHVKSMIATLGVARSRNRSCCAIDPFDHPDIQRMTLCQLADLPFAYSTVPIADAARSKEDAGPKACSSD